MIIYEIKYQVFDSYNHRHMEPYGEYFMHESDAKEWVRLENEKARRRHFEQWLSNLGKSAARDAEHLALAKAGLRAPPEKPFYYKYVEPRDDEYAYDECIVRQSL